MMNPASSESSMISPLMGLFIPRSLRSSSIDEILNKPDPKLEDLLDDDSFSYELKNCNPKLMDYFTKNRQNIKHVIDYITQMPPDENDKKRAFKYPFLVCEIFESDITPLMNSFFLNMKVGKGNEPPLKKREIQDDYEVILSNESAESADQENKIHSEFKKQEHEDYVEVSEAIPKTDVKRKDLQNKKKLESMSLMDYLFAFIHINDQLNPVLSGYFSKLVLALFKKNSTKMVEYVYQNSDNLHRMVYHLADRSMAELLSVFLTYETLHFEERRQQITDIKLEIIGEIFKYLIDSNETELIANSGYILTDILLKSDASIDGKEMLHKITTPEHFNLLFKRFKTQDNEIINHFGIIIYSLISFYTPHGYHFDPHSGEEPKIDENKVNQDPVLAILMQQFPLFTQILSREDPEEIQTSFGAKTKLLGSAKLRVIELIHRMVRVKSSKLHQKLYNSKLLNLITQLFFQFQWNNILHDTYERLIKTIIERGSSILYDALFIGANFISLLVKEAKDPNYVLPKKGRKVRKGNMGHVFRIINFLVDHSKKNEKLLKYFAKFADWNNFVETTLAENNTFNSIADLSSKLKEHPVLTKKEKSLSRLSKDQGFGEIAPSDKDVLAKMPTGFVSVSITRDELDKKSVIDIGFASVENESDETLETMLTDDPEMPKRSHLERKAKTLEEERSSSFSPALESQKDLKVSRSSYTPSTSPKKRDPAKESFFGNEQNYDIDNEIDLKKNYSMDSRGSEGHGQSKIMFAFKSKQSELENMAIKNRFSEPANLKLVHTNSTENTTMNPKMAFSTGAMSSSTKNLKLKVKIKKGDKDDPKKILEKLEQYGRTETNASKMNNSDDYGADPSKLDYVIAPDNINEELVLSQSNEVIGNSK